LQIFKSDDRPFEEHRNRDARIRRTGRSFHRHAITPSREPCHDLHVTIVTHLWA